jgi:hypothetical protein
MTFTLCISFLIPFTIYGIGIWGESPIAEPYGYVQDGTFSGPAAADSPDPLAAFRGNNTPSASNNPEIYLRKPVSISADTPASFGNLSSLPGTSPNVTISGTGSIRMNFGIENAAWLELDSKDVIHAWTFGSTWHITGIRIVCQTKPANYSLYWVLCISSG